MTSSDMQQHPSLSERLARLVSDLQSRGVQISDGVQVQEIPGRGIGVVARRVIPAGERIVQFPVNALLNPRTVKAAILQEISDGGQDAASSIFKSTARKNQDVNERKRLKRHMTVKSQVGKYADLLDSLSSHQVLAYYLYREKLRRDSEWNSFLDVLPTLEMLHVIPLVWDLLDRGRKRLLEYLPASTYDHAARMSNQFWDDLKAVQDIFIKVEDIELFIWAWLCVNSRCLYYEMAEARTSNDCMTLAPVIDFLNHSDQEHCSVQVYNAAQAMKFFGLVTTCSYDVGEEVYLSYGAHTNSFLLCEYGFTLATNKNSELDITAELLMILKRGGRRSCDRDNETAKMESSKLKFLEAHGYLGDYTLSLDTISYRTEVALAVAQVREEVCREPTSDEPQARTLERSQLKAFIAGMSNGWKFKAKSTEMLKAILEEVVKNSDIVLSMSNDEVKGDAENRDNIRRLYVERKHIARAHLGLH
ncbi:uncharacterized protein V1513DRAFT_476922 [Lipomyces chichibuensis]|uniref:uncharacterized protein n=1 Tax=Lipomyces chichibuensis TaxID=1546026 RepID=UPI003343B668